MAVLLTRYDVDVLFVLLNELTTLTKKMRASASRTWRDRQQVCSDEFWMFSPSVRPVPTCQLATTAIELPPLNGMDDLHVADMHDAVPNIPIVHLHLRHAICKR